MYCETLTPTRAASPSSRRHTSSPIRMAVTRMATRGDALRAIARESMPYPSRCMGVDDGVTARFARLSSDAPEIHPSGATCWRGTPGADGERACTLAGGRATLVAERLRRRPSMEQSQDAYG